MRFHDPTTVTGALLLGVHVAACGARTAPIGADTTDSDDAGAADASGADAGATLFPVGTYTHCAQGQRAEDGNMFLNGAGFSPHAALTLTQDGGTVSAKYVAESGNESSLDFTITANASATLAHATTLDAGLTGLCVLGIGVQNEVFYPTIMTTSAAALSYDAGAVFVSLQGVVHGDQSPCGAQSSPASVWIVCESGPSSHVIATKAPLPIPELPVGEYTCSSQIATFYSSEGMNQYVTSGGEDGTLTLTQAGAGTTATYSGDWSVLGTLQMNIASATTAIMGTPQSLTTPCLVPIGIGSPPPQTPETLSIAAGALTLGDASLLLAFAGRMGASAACSGAEKAGALICSKQ